MRRDDLLRIQIISKGEEVWRGVRRGTEMGGRASAGLLLLCLLASHGLWASEAAARGSKVASSAAGKPTLTKELLQELRAQALKGGDGVIRFTDDMFKLLMRRCGLLVGDGLAWGEARQQAWPGRVCMHAWWRASTRALASACAPPWTCGCMQQPRSTHPCLPQPPSCPPLPHTHSHHAAPTATSAWWSSWMPSSCTTSRHWRCPRCARSSRC